MEHHRVRDQYQDQNDASHNIGQAEVEQASGLLIQQGATPLFALPEFDSAGGWQPALPNNPSPPPDIGTTNLQDITRLLSEGGQGIHGRHGKPTAVIVSTDNGQTWQFVADVIASAQ